MKRIFYLNVNYCCNNACMFCFSQNTYRQTRPAMDYTQAQNLCELFDVGVGDRVVLNGGEPTLHPNLPEFLTCFAETGAETVLYSNGRYFSKRDYTMQIVESGVSRITIPIHGMPTDHDRMTQIKGSFGETVSGLKNIASCQSSVNLELKLIITKPIIETIMIKDWLEKVLERPEQINTLVLSGLVDTEISRLNGIENPGDDRTAQFVSESLQQLDTCVHFNFLGVKIVDVALCKLHPAVLRRIDNGRDISLDSDFESFHFFDGQVIESVRMEYRKKTSRFPDCLHCRWQELCSTINDRYRVLNSAGGRWFYSPE